MRALLALLLVVLSGGVGHGQITTDEGSGVRRLPDEAEVGRTLRVCGGRIDFGSFFQVECPVEPPVSVESGADGLGVRIIGQPGQGTLDGTSEDAGWGGDVRIHGGVGGDAPAGSFRGVGGDVEILAGQAGGGAGSGGLEGTVLIGGREVRVEADVLVTTGGPEVDVRAYGAIGDGVTDDTAAINAALAEVADGGTLRFPCGTFKITSTITITGYAKYLVGCGNPNNGSSTTAGTRLTFAGSGPMFILGGSPAAANLGFARMGFYVSSPSTGVFDIRDQARFFRFEDLYLEGYNTTTPIGFKLTGETGCNCFHIFDKVQARNFAKAWLLSGYANANSIRQCHCGVVGTCLDLSPTGTDTKGGDDNLVERTEFNGSVTLGLNLVGADRNVFQKVVADGPVTSMAIDSTSDHNKFEGCSLPNHAVTTAVLANQTLDSTKYSSTVDQAIGAHAGFHRFFEVDAPETCNANLSGAYYSDLSMGRLCRCNGTTWCDWVTGVCGSNTSCGTTLGGQEVDVRAYGAVGDGVTDDTTEIRAAEAACPSTGCTLLFSGPGTFLISDEVTYRSNQRWVFRGGAVLKLANASVANLIRTVSSSTVTGMVQPSASAQTNVRFEGMILDGNKANNPTVNSGDGLNLLDVTDVQVTGVTIRQVPRDGLTIGESAAGTTANVVVAGFVGDDIGLAGVNGGSGIAVTSGDDVTISGCYIASSERDGIDIEPNASRVVRRVTIEGCHAINNTLNGFVIDPNAGGAESVQTVSYVGNHAHGNSGHGFWASGGFGTILGLTYVGNTAYRNQDDGFRVTDQSFVTYTGNHAIENSTTAAGAFSGFFVDAINSTFVGNAARDDQGAKTQQYGFEEDAGSSGNTWRGNVATAHQANRFFLSGAAYGTATAEQMLGGAVVTGHLSANASVDFDNIVAPPDCNDKTITVTGAVLGDTVFAGPRAEHMVADGVVTAWVSAADTVTVRLCVLTGANVNAAAAFLRVDVVKH